MERLICLILGYCFGMIQTSYLYGRLHNIDIRQQGSGNAGATNALRVLGKKAGLIVFLGDFLKMIAAAGVVYLLFGKSNADIIKLLILYTGLGVVLGHTFPFYLKFKGGKGIAAMAGILVVTDWRITLICFVAFVSVVAITRYVSLGSLVIVTIFFFGVLIFGYRGDYGVTGSSLYEMYGVAFLLTALPYYKHRANIVRLIHGTESKIGSKK